MNPQKQYLPPKVYDVWTSLQIQIKSSFLGIFFQGNFINHLVILQSTVVPEGMDWHGTARRIRIVGLSKLSSFFDLLVYCGKCWLNVKPSPYL